MNMPHTQIQPQVEPQPRHDHADADINNVDGVNGDNVGGTNGNG